MSKNVELVQLSDISVPPIQEVTNKNFVWNGDKNCYFRMLIDLYTASSTNNAVINEISRLIYGKGLAIADENDPEAYAEDSPVIEEINKLIKPKDLKRFITDRVILGNAALQVIYKGIGNRKQIAEIKHFPVHTLAAEKIKSVEVEGYYYHPKWEDYKQGDTLKRLPAFGYGGNIEIYVCKPYCPNMPYWSPVDYSGSLDYCKLEEMIACHLVNHVQRGFSATKIINVNKMVDTDEEKEEIKDYITDNFAGVSGDPTIVSFNSAEGEGITVENITVDGVTKQFEYLASEACRKILTGHRVTNPKLLGVPSMKGEGSGLGNNANEIEVAFDLFHNTVIDPFQDEILDGLKELFAINNIEEEIEFQRVEPLREDLYGHGQEGDLENFDSEDVGSERDKESEESNNEANAGY